MKKDVLLLSFLFLFSGIIVLAREYHVSVHGDDQGDGTIASPFRTISKAAEQAVAGDIIIVHEGVYREWVNPPRGGESDEKRIVYRAGEGEKVVIKGSEIIRGWKKFRGDVWRVTLPDTFFGNFNPYKEILHGDWFNDRGRIHHPGEVYVNGQSLYESATLENLFVAKTLKVDGKNLYPWYCETDKDNTYIYACFHGLHPNREQVEINVRRTCFYPEKPGVNYITVKGFIMRQAATPWAPPTAEQPGLLGTHWSKGWIIEDNVISDSKCVGITLGKDRKSGQNVWSKNPCIDGATHYNEVIFRALKEGWSKEHIGSHIVRNNTIYNCEQAGIVGSLGAVYSQICENHIYNIWIKRLFTGAEIAGIKIHAAIDVKIRQNRIHNVGRGIWLDWMAQGTRVSGNLLYDNTEEDLFVEVDHGPFLVDNNLFLSPKSLRNWSEGAACVHNLMAGYLEVYEERARYTPYMFAHSTQVAGLRNIHDGQQRYYNNIFMIPDARKSIKIPGNRHYMWFAWGLAAYDRSSHKMMLDGNVYLNGAKPYRLEPGYLAAPDFDPGIQIEEKGKHVYLSLTFPDSLKNTGTPFITTAFLGKTKISRLPYENPDATPLQIDTDYFGNTRNNKNPVPGPFENITAGKVRLEVW